MHSQTIICSKQASKITIDYFLQLERHTKATQKVE